MDEMIKSMVDALKKYNAGYVSVRFGEYSIIVADAETMDFIESALDEEEME